MRNLIYVMSDDQGNMRDGSVRINAYAEGVDMRNEPVNYLVREEVVDIERLEHDIKYKQDELDDLAKKLKIAKGEA